MSPGDSLSAYELDATGKSIGLVPPSDQGEGALCSPAQNSSCVLGRRRVLVCIWSSLTRCSWGVIAALVTLGVC